MHPEGGPVFGENKQGTLGGRDRMESYFIPMILVFVNPGKICIALRLIFAHCCKCVTFPLTPTAFMLHELLEIVVLVGHCGSF